VVAGRDEETLIHWRCTPWQIVYLSSRLEF
jgi:hypothetical protein